MWYSLPWKHVTLFLEAVFYLSITHVSFEFNQWSFDDLSQTLDKIVKFIVFVYQNCTKYIILHDYNLLWYQTV